MVGAAPAFSFGSRPDGGAAGGDAGGGDGAGGKAGEAGEAGAGEAEAEHGGEGAPLLSSAKREAGAAS